MLIWLAFGAWWLLPLFGLLVGWATNWLALKMIFNPRRPMWIGPVTIQGLFFKRQQEVSTAYGRLVATQLLTPQHILEKIFDGSYAGKLFALVRREAQQTIDSSTGWRGHW